MGEVHICGDDRCDTTVECQQGCSLDCGPQQCKNGICEPQVGENCNSSIDCQPPQGYICNLSRKGSDIKGWYKLTCGDGYCDIPFESKQTCCTDCGCNYGYHCIFNKCSTVCGDGLCIGNETQSTCCVDCGCPVGYKCLNNACTIIPPEVDLKLSAPSEAYSSVLYALPTYPGFASATIKNNGNTTIYKISVTFKLSNFANETFFIEKLKPKQTQVFTWDPTFSRNVLIKNGGTYPVEVSVKYNDEKGNTYKKEATQPILIKGYNSYDWSQTCVISAYITSTNENIRQIASYITAGSSTGTPLEREQVAEKLYEYLQNINISYISDPNDPIGGVDWIQLPAETLKNGGGDCDDLSILYASLLESVGIQTELVVVPGHVFPCWFYNSTNVECVETTFLNNRHATYLDANWEAYYEWNAYLNNKTIIETHKCWQSVRILQPPT